MSDLQGVAGSATATNERDTRLSALDYRVDGSTLKTVEDIAEFIGLAGFFMNSEDPNFSACAKYLDNVSIQEQMQRENLAAND